MYPPMSSNDITTYVPVSSVESVQIDDIVFCEVQPGSRFYAHLAKDKSWANEEWYFTISGINGNQSGWCRIWHICGLLVDVHK